LYIHIYNKEAISVYQNQSFLFLSLTKINPYSMTYGQAVGGAARDKPIGAAEKKNPRQSAGNENILSCNTTSSHLATEILRASIFFYLSRRLHRTFLKQVNIHTAIQNVEAI
jgi:hypothetical protein